MNYPQRRVPYKMRLFGKASTYHGVIHHKALFPEVNLRLAKRSFLSKAKAFLLLNEKKGTC